MIIGMYLPDQPQNLQGKQLRTASAIHFAGRYRLIDFTLSNLVNSGVNNVFVLLGAHYQSLMDHIGSGRNWDLSRKTGGVTYFPPYLTDRQSTGAFDRAIRHLNSSRNVDTVILCDGTALYNLDYRPVIRQHNATFSAATLLVDGETGESMNTIVFRKEVLLNVLAEITDGEDWSYSGILKILRSLYKVNNYGFGGYHGKVSGLNSFYRYNMDMLDPAKRKALFHADDGGRVYTSVRDSLPSRYGKLANVSNSIVADGCQIDGTVENSVLFRRVKVSAGAILRNCIIQEDTTIEPGAELSNVVTDRKVIVTPGRMVTGGADGKLLYIGEGSIF